MNDYADFRIVPTDQLHAILRGGGVTRFHTETMIKEQDVAQHTWRVMAVLHSLCSDRVFSDMCKSVMYHDVAEGYMGDIPAPIKRMLGEPVKEMEKEIEKNMGIPSPLRELGPSYDLLKLADYLECMITIVEEREMGNRTLDHIFDKLSEYIEEITDKDRLPRVVQVMVLDLYTQTLGRYQRA